MFVKPDALLPVLARPKTVELEDGTKLELAAGVPVIQSGDEGLVLIDDVLLDVQLTDADVGRWSAAALYEPAPDLPEADLATAGVVLHYGNRSITSNSARFAAANDVDDANLLTFVNACGRFVLRPGVHRTPKEGLYRLKGPASAIPASDRELDPDSILGSASKPAPCPLQAWRAVADAPLRWPSGAVAGKVLTSHPLPETATQSGDQVCVELSGLEVCLDAELDPHVLDCTPRGQKEFPEFDVPKGRRVTRGEPTVSAGLESDIVERIVRAHASETLACYDAGLTRDPTLAGRIEIAFVIGRTGRVSISKVHSSTLAPELDHTNVATCVSRAIKRWSFPKARDGVTVSVVYPFDLSPS